VSDLFNLPVSNFIEIGRQIDLAAWSRNQLDELYRTATKRKTVGVTLRASSEAFGAGYGLHLFRPSHECLDLAVHTNKRYSRLGGGRAAIQAHDAHNVLYVLTLGGLANTCRRDRF
jgi:hypothetical protein